MSNGFILIVYLTSFAVEILFFIVSSNAMGMKEMPSGRRSHIIPNICFLASAASFIFGRIGV